MYTVHVGQVHLLQDLQAHHTRFIALCVHSARASLRCVWGRMGGGGVGGTDTRTFFNM